MRTLLVAVLFLSGMRLSSAETETRMHVTGPFDVAVKPDAEGKTSYRRMLLTKQYHGALEADATGEMLSGGDPKSGTAGYVAIETVSGALAGKHGTFQLMHWGTMQGGKQELRIGVVPGSGTGALHGLSGTMSIEVAAGGRHSYALDYQLPPSL